MVRGDSGGDDAGDAGGGGRSARRGLARAPARVEQWQGRAEWVGRRGRWAERRLAEVRKIRDEVKFGV